MLNVQRISIYDTDVSIVWPSLLICINNGAESINCHISSKRIDVIITCILFVHTHIHGDQWSHHLIYYMSIFIYLLFTIAQILWPPSRYADAAYYIIIIQNNSVEQANTSYLRLFICLFVTLISHSSLLASLFSSKKNPNKQDCIWWKKNLNGQKFGENFDSI